MLHTARVKAFLGRLPDAAAEGDVPADPALAALIDHTAAMYAQAITDSTRAAYARRWTLFEEWCATQELASLPAAPEAVMLYLTTTVGTKAYSLPTIRGWVAAINRVHIEAGLPAPGMDPGVTLLMRGLSRSQRPRPPHPSMSALKIAEVRTVCELLDRHARRPIDLRDRAVLALHRVGLGDGEIARLRLQDVEIGSARALVTVRATERTPPREVILRHGPKTGPDPLEALTQFVELRGTEPGHLFVSSAAHRHQLPPAPKGIYSIRHSRSGALSSHPESPELDEVIDVLGRDDSEVLRDKALILLGFAGAFRRVDLVRLRWSDITLKSNGLLVLVRHSKTDQAGRGRSVGIPRGQSEVTCPVRAVLAWRGRCEQRFGADRLSDLPCFVRVGRSGRLGTDPLTPEALAYLVRRRAEQAGLEGRWGGRSLRAGFISTAADLDIPLHKIARQSGHATLDSLIRYIRADDPFRANPADRLGL